MLLESNDAVVCRTASARQLFAQRLGMAPPRHALGAAFAVLGFVGATASLTATATEPPPLAEPPEPWAAGIFTWAGSPLTTAAAPLIGVGLRLRHDCEDGPWHLGVESAYGTTTTYHDAYQATQHDAQIVVAAGAAWRLGAGRLFGDIHLGARLAIERQQRQDGRRLAAAGLSSTRTSGWSLGPTAGCVAGLSIRFYDLWELSVSGGPAVTSVVMANATRPQPVLNWRATGGIARAF